MTLRLVACGIAALLPLAISQNDAGRGRQDLVTVSGCVRGSSLKRALGDNSDSVAMTLRASEYLLEGSKELLQSLRRDHDGHYEEVTGTLKAAPGTNPNDALVRQKQLGSKTRVTLGARRANGEDGPNPVRLVISSYRHLAGTCQAG